MMCHNCHIIYADTAGRWVHGIKHGADNVAEGFLNEVGLPGLYHLGRNVIDPGFNLVTGIADEVLGKKLIYQLSLS